MKRRRIRQLELDVLALAQSCNLLVSALYEITPRDDGAAIILSRILDQERRRTQEIIDRYSNFTVGVDNGR